MNPYLSVIVPAYNEASRIGNTLEKISTTLAGTPFSWEIIVVADGPTDQTAQVVTQLTSRIPHLRLINRKENRGKGYSVREGMLASTGKIRLFTDADNSTDISHFMKMRQFFDEGYEVVICSRDTKDASGARQAVAQSAFKRMLGNLGNLYVQIVAVRGVWDTQCGFKAFTAEAAEKIFGVSRIDRWGFDIEALALARMFGYRIGIVGAHWINDPRSHVKLSSYLSVLWETTKVGWWIRFGGYKK